MRFLLLVHDPGEGDAGGPPASLFEAMTELRADTTDGEIVGDGGLLPREPGALVRTEGGRVSVLDGPFAEAKEVIGGFFIVESPSPEAMARWTRAFVEMHAVHWSGLAFTAEVRQIAEGPNG